MAVVENLDVLPDRCFRVSPCSVLLMMNHLVLQTAPEALHGGIVVTVPLARHGCAHAELRDEALALARHLASQPTYGLALIKRSLNASFDNGFDQQLELERDLQRLAGRSEDYREGVSAFMNKRTPAFKGR